MDTEDVNKLSYWRMYKRETRLVAVQCVYAARFVSFVDDEDFWEHVDLVQSELRCSCDRKMLMKMESLIVDMPADIDVCISDRLRDAWIIERVDAVSLSIIRTALIERRAIGTNVHTLLDEYVNIASALLEKVDLAFVNAILSRCLMVDMFGDSTVDADSGLVSVSSSTCVAN